MGVTLRALLQWQQYGVNSPTHRKSGVGLSQHTTANRGISWQRVQENATLKMGKKWTANGKGTLAIFAQRY